MKQFCVLLVFIAVAQAQSFDGLLKQSLDFVKDCNDKSLTLCIKVRKDRKLTCVVMESIRK
jgi:hypothetical protein